MQMLRASLVLAVSLVPFSAHADKVACAKGAVVGGVAGVLARHPVLGAAAGCAAGHYMATKKEAQKRAEDARNQPPKERGDEETGDPAKGTAPPSPPRTDGDPETPRSNG